MIETKFQVALQLEQQHIPLDLSVQVRFVEVNALIARQEGLLSDVIVYCKIAEPCVDVEHLGQPFTVSTAQVSSLDLPPSQKGAIFQKLTLLDFTLINVALVRTLVDLTPFGETLRCVHLLLREQYSRQHQ